MATNDVLPWQPNTGPFYAFLEHEFKRAARYGSDITLMFVEISQLDEISRKLGKLSAVHILREIVRLIRANLRAADREFIYGMNEFMIILPHTPKDSACHMVPKLTRLIESYPVWDRNGSRVFLEPRFGVASCSTEGRSGGGEIT